MLKGIFYEMLMRNYTANVELVFDWFIDPDESKDSTTNKPFNSLIESFNNTIIKEEILMETPDPNNFKGSELFGEEPKDSGKNLGRHLKGPIINSLKNNANSSRSDSEEDNETERILDLKPQNDDEVKKIINECKNIFLFLAKTNSKTGSEKKDSESKVMDIPSEHNEPKRSEVGFRDSRKDVKSTGSNFNLFGKTESASSSKKNKNVNEDENLEIFMKNSEIHSNQSFGKKDFVALNLNKMNK